MLFRNVYGLDLGTYDIKVYDKKRKLVWKEKNSIAIQNKKEIFASGDEAYEMYEKAPEGVGVIFPMREGAIAEFTQMQNLLETLLKKERPFSKGGEYLLAVPTDATSIEKRACYDLVVHSSARAKSVRIMEKGIADAISAGIDVSNTNGDLIVNFGAGTTEISVIASGNLILNRLLKIGGIHLDASITHLVRKNLDFMIGDKTAEALRKRFGVVRESTDSSLEISGRNLTTRCPESKKIPMRFIRTAMKEPLETCVDTIQMLLDRTPPLVRKSIYEHGIYITGGVANMVGLSTYLKERLELDVNRVKDPEYSTVCGLESVIGDKKQYKTLTYSMLDEDYRWLQ